MSKSKIIVSFLVCVFAFSLASCARDSSESIYDKPAEQTDIAESVSEENVKQEGADGPISITALSAPEVLVSEEIAEQSLGENSESAYYELITAQDGTRSYRVVRASDGEPVDLPAPQTVLYLSEDSVHYYEKVRYAYKANGEDTETIQYAIHAPDPDAGENTAEDSAEDNAAETAAN